MRHYEIVATKAYKKDYKRLIKSGLDVEKLETAIDRIATGLPLDARYRDHALKGAFADTRECHIGPDWLLMYKKDRDKFLLLLLRTGTHRDVLGIE